MRTRKYRILMFSPAFAPYSFSESITASKLALALQNKGWHIDVISRIGEGPNYSAEWDKLWLPLKHFTHIIEYPIGEKVQRSVDLLLQVKRAHYPIDGIRWAGRALDKAFELHKSMPYNLVISRSPTDIGHVPALEFSRFMNVPWLANWNDPPAHLWPVPYKSESNLFKKYFFNKLLVNVLNKANIITFPSERLRDHVLALSKKTPLHNKTEIIPHIGLIDYEQSQRKPDGCFRIAHAGNLSAERNPAAFFTGFSQFVKNASIKHPVELVIIGMDNPHLMSLAKDYGIQQYIIFTGGLHYSATLPTLAQSDVLAVVEAPCDEGIFLPSKIIDYVQVGRPILAVAPHRGTLADLLNATNAGIAAPCGQPADIANGLLTFYHSWIAGKINDDYPSKELWAQFHPDRITAQYEKIFSTLVN